MKKILLGFVLVFVTLFTNVLAKDNPRAVIIFDASGSMWGQINGVTKIEIARDALKNVVREWNPNVELGLTVYGHRSKGDCNDIETIIPVGKIDKNRVIKTVMGIKPKGKTPISRSLRKVAEEIKYTEEKATIILISDGKETCDPDPCGTAKELEAQGIDFVTHVIGFNVDKKTDKQLECIADATGGEYFSAKNATALNEAMKVIAKKVEVVTPPPAPKLVVKKPQYNLEVSASETEDGKWVKAGYNVYKLVDGKPNRIDGCRSTTKDPCKESLEAGKYLIKASYIDYENKKEVLVSDMNITKLHFVMGETGTVEITASEEEGGKWVKASGSLYKADGDRLDGFRVGKKKGEDYQLQVGKYYVEMSCNGLGQKAIFEIKANEITKLNVVMGHIGTVEISASEKEGGKWVKAGHYLYENEDGKAGERVGSAHSRKKEAGKDILPVGKYIVKSEYNAFKKETPFEIKPGETTKVHIIFGETGTVEISASEKEGGKWVKAGHYLYENEDGKAGERVGSAHSRKKEPGKDILPVGKYIVKSEYNAFKKEMPFEIKPGETTKVHIIFGETGTVEISASEKEGGKWVKAGHYLYENEDGKAGERVGSAHSRKKEPGKDILPVGKYNVKSEYNAFKKETPFEIKAGETTKVHVVFGQFFIEAKCTNMGDEISYEIYASNGQLVDEKKVKCSDTLKVTLDNGDYSVEVKVGNDKKEVKFTVGGGSNKLLIDMTDIKREPTKEELIKADSEEAIVVPVTSKTTEVTKIQKQSSQINIGGKKIEIEGVSKKEAKQIEQLGAMLGALGGMMNGANSEEQKDEQNNANTEADKEFDEMSKDLDMFTK